MLVGLRERNVFEVRVSGDGGGDDSDGEILS